MDEEENEDDCGIRMPFDLNGKVYGVNNENTLYEKNGKQPTAINRYSAHGTTKTVVQSSMDKYGEKGGLG